MKSRLAAAALAAALLASAGCGDDTPVESDAGPTPPDAFIPETCMVAAPTECPNPEVTYEDIEPIVAERCVICHGTLEGHWPLDEYSHLVDWHMDIRAVMLSCSMPPDDAGVPMANAEREKILEWIRCGLQE